jgi:hypothetical protein
MAIVRFLLVSAVVFCLLARGSASVCAGVVTSTANQNGTQIISGSGGAVSKIGTFDFSPVAESYIEVRLRTIVELSEQSIGPNAPKLVFSPYFGMAPDASFVVGEIFGTNVYTDLSVENVAPTSLGVEDRQSIWIPLSPTQGNKLQSIIAADPEGRVDAWLYSATNQNFSTPDGYSYFEFGPNGEITEVTQVFTATIDLFAIPEPSSCIVMGGLLLTYLGYRRKRICTAESTLP